jgi:hypothetical protein
MRKVFVAAALVTAFGIYTFAQTTEKPRLLLSIVAGAIERRPVFGYDGILREGPAQNVVTAVGSAVININDIQMTAEKAVWRWGSREVELTTGKVSVSVGLPMAPNAFHFQQRR